MDEILFFLLMVGAAVTAVFLVVWIAVAAIAKVLAWLLVVWVILFAVGVLGGILNGVVQPPRVLRNRAATRPEVASPEAVVAGNVLGARTRGAARNFGWDSAWPLYVPYQSRRDLRAVVAQNRAVLRTVQVRTFELLDDLFDDLYGLIICLVLFAVPYAGFWIGAWVSTLAWAAVMVVLGRTVALVQLVGTSCYRWFDKLARKRIDATFNCTSCHRVSQTPSYRCPNGACEQIHRDVSPGALGIVNRRCSCGTSMPTTVRAAARVLIAVCPYCDAEAHAGSGARKVVAIPVVGSVGAGKTQLLTAGVVAADERARSLGGRLEALNPAAQDFLTAARGVVGAGRGVVKTDWTHPEGVPFLLGLNDRDVELLIVDAAGELFAEHERARGLNYFDTSDVVVLVLDPFAFPQALDLLRAAGLGHIPVASGDPETAYGTVVDRMRDQGLRVGRKHLAVAVTKVDVVQQLPGATALVPGDGASVRAWIEAHGGANFVRRMDLDFKSVEFFAVDSFRRREALDPLHPLRVIDWVLRKSGARMELLPAPVSVGEESA
ncbi:hypothetical protein [Nocardioides sp. W7]|uniref:TRAFAC clade GTPase domain-containing protein n=1 Tax=Nocardioides sp. W7 TaxID=2931390 RepID=UPI001FD1E8BD|nr:hypothetical protein [Nocardioides sp. W7]